MIDFLGATPGIEPGYAVSTSVMAPRPIGAVEFATDPPSVFGWARLYAKPGKNPSSTDATTGRPRTFTVCFAQSEPVYAVRKFRKIGDFGVSAPKNNSAVLLARGVLGDADRAHGFVELLGEGFGFLPGYFF